MLKKMKRHCETPLKVAELGICHIWYFIPWLLTTRNKAPIIVAFVRTSRSKGTNGKIRRNEEKNVLALQLNTRQVILKTLHQNKSIYIDIFFGIHIDTQMFLPTLYNACIYYIITEL